MNICVFGDSITWGAFLPFRVGWANLLRNYLEKEFDSISLYDLGIDANTTLDLLNRFEVEVAARSPEILIFAIGVNDSCYRKIVSNALVTSDEFEKNISNLIEKASKVTEKIVFVGLTKGSDSLTIPLSRSTTGKCYTKDRVEKYDAIVKKLCNSNGIAFVDIFNLLKEEDFDDGLHPNINGHIKIFEAVRQSLLDTKFLN